MRSPGNKESEDLNPWDYITSEDALPMLMVYTMSSLMIKDGHLVNKQPKPLKNRKKKSTGERTTRTIYESYERAFRITFDMWAEKGFVEEDGITIKLVGSGARHQSYLKKGGRTRESGSSVALRIKLKDNLRKTMAFERQRGKFAIELEDPESFLSARKQIITNDGYSSFSRGN